MTFEEILKENGILTYTNVGTSMLPLIREGKDILVIEPLSREPEARDAVLFVRRELQGRGRYVLHRILKKNKDGSYYIIGDNLFRGENVKREDIIGILTSVRRQGGKTLKSGDAAVKTHVVFWYLCYPVRRVINKVTTVKKVKGNS